MALDKKFKIASSQKFIQKLTSSRLPKKDNRDWLIIAAIYLLASLILYSYYWFFSPTKMEIIYQNWDGPVYAAIAQSFYIPKTIDTIPYAQFLRDANYLTSAFPLYPIAIKIFSAIGYFKSMIFVSQLAGLAAIITFYELVKKNKLTGHPLILSIIFIFLSPRWFISTHTGSSNPMFVLFILLTLYFFAQNKYLKSGFFLMLAQLTRSQGLIFFTGFTFVIAWQVLNSHKYNYKMKLKIFFLRFWPFLLSPLALICVFFYFQLVLGDFWALFGGLKKWPFMASYPFQVFTVYPTRLIQTFWLENHYWIYFSNLLAVLFLIKNKKYWLAIPTLVYAIPLIFLVNMDLGHYNEPLIPFQLIAFEALLSSRLFLITTLASLPAQYLYTISFMYWSR